jgi:hypothetical protein
VKPSTLSPRTAAVARLAIVIGLLVAQLSFAAGPARAQECDPTVTTCTDPTPTSDPSPTDPTPSPEPSPEPTTDPTTPAPEPSPSATDPGPSPEPSSSGGNPSPSAEPSPTQGGSDAGGTRTSSSAPTKRARQSAQLEGCGDAEHSLEVGSLLAAPAPPYVLPEPPGMWGPQDTGRVESILSGLKGRPRMSRAQAFREVAGPFPVAGPASWADDWHNYRACPKPHLHMGLDIFAAWGTPLVAVAHGRVTKLVNQADSAGLAVEIVDRNGIQYLYAHLSSFAPGLRAGQPVRQGQVLGRVGTTGNAAGTAPHVHFEVQPGGLAMPPKPLVDRWLLVAEKRARILVSKGREALTEHKAQESSFLPLGFLGEVVDAAAAAPLKQDGGAADASGGTIIELASLGGGLAVVGMVLGAIRLSRRRRPAGLAGEAPITLTLTPIPTPIPPTAPTVVTPVLAPPVQRLDAAGTKPLSAAAVGLIGLGFMSVMLLALWTVMSSGRRVRP